MRAGGRGMDGVVLVLLIGAMLLLGTGWLGGKVGGAGVRPAGGYPIHLKGDPE